MMISPNGYWEENLAGKPTKYVISQIRALQKERKELINGNYDPMFISPSPDVQIQMYQEYIDYAIAKLGDKYYKTKPELAQDDFQNRLDTLVRFEYVTQSFFYGLNTFTAELTSDCKAYKQTIQHAYFELMEHDNSIIVAKDEFLTFLKSLRMFEWKRYYKYDDVYVLDGGEWTITLTFQDGKTKKYHGINAQPWNYDKVSEYVDEVFD